MRHGPHPAPTGASAKRSSLCGASKVAKVGSIWARVKCILVSAKVRPQAAASHKKVFAPQKGLRSAGGRAIKVAKVGPLRARVKSAKLPPTPYVYFPLVGGLHNPLGWAFSRYSNAKERVLYHGGVVATKVRYFGVKSTYTLADCGSTVALLPTVVFCSFGRDYTL